MAGSSSYDRQVMPGGTVDRLFLPNHDRQKYLNASGLNQVRIKIWLYKKNKRRFQNNFLDQVRNRCRHKAGCIQFRRNTLVICRYKTIENL